MKQPLILQEGSYGAEDLTVFRKRYDVWKEVNLYEEQLEELFDVQNPELLNTVDYNSAKASYLYRHTNEESCNGDWVYFPWSGYLCHLLTKEQLRELRTNRNREIISLNEQHELAQLCIGVCGLSVGGNMAISLGYSGIGSTFKLSDFDTLSTSNLNRMLSTLPSVGLPKIDIVSQTLFELDPHLQIQGFEDGLDEENLHHFVNAEPKPAMIFEEIDDFRMKVRLREEARKAGVPIIMLTCIGDRLLVDIERYDLNPDTPLFNGRVDEATINSIGDNPSEDEKKRIALQIVNPENLDQVVIDSVQAINQTLVGRPQVMSTILTSAGVAAFLARQIALKKTDISGRKVIRFMDTFLPELIPITLKT